jgi:hypothetical protein
VNKRIENARDLLALHAFPSQRWLCNADSQFRLDLRERISNSADRLLESGSGRKEVTGLNWSSSVFKPHSRKD